MRSTPSPSSELALLALFDPRVLLRWIYIGRMSIASAIFVAAIFRWFDATNTATLIASLTFAVTTIVTAISAGYSSGYRRPLGQTFMYLQLVFDLLLVTAVVHITGPAGGSESPTQFASLYIVVISIAPLLLHQWGGLLIAALADVVYLADIVVFAEGDVLSQWVWAQLALFAVVALVTAYLIEHLRRGREGTAALAGRLDHVRLRAEDILRNINSGVITIDPLGRLVYVNPTAERLLGLSLASQTNRVVLDQVRSRAPALAAALERSVHDRARTNRAESSVRADGRDFPIGVTTTFMEDGEGHVSATAIFQDISDSKRMETLRVRAERLEGIAELSASLAHEIKNPLASIRSSVEQIAKRKHEGDDERTLSALVLRESDRLSRLLTEFLDFARVRVARADTIDLGEISRNVARLVAGHPEASGIVVECRVPDDLPVKIVGDEDLMHRAIFNLALNAVQASSPGSTVTIDVLNGAQAEDEQLDPGSVGVRVTDHGPGIADEVRGRLFDPFTTTKPQGTGLGLAVVHRAIVAHRGLVLVDSGGQGTRVTIVVPSGSAVDAPALA